MPDHPDFDVVVLGGDPAGIRVAGELARAGRTVALIEPEPELGEVGEVGAPAAPPRPRSAALSAAGVTVLSGPARIVRPGTVEVVDGAAGKAAHGYTDLVLCTAGEPIRPALPGLADIPTWTSDEALCRPDLPRRLVVLGGGPAGCELAQLYAASGSQVTVVDEPDRLLATEAPFLGTAVGDALRRTGAVLRLGVRLDRVDRTDTGFRLCLGDGPGIVADRLLIATERRPRLDDLGLECLGIDPAAELTADETGRVAPHVWAAGAVTGGPPGTRTAAAYQADVVAANILGRRRKAGHRAIPRVVHTTPAAYAVGVSPGEDGDDHDELITAGVGLFEIAPPRITSWERARGVLPDGGRRGRLELYADRSRGILVGAAAVGPHAAEWMSEVALAIQAEIQLCTLAEVVRAYPTYGEAIGIAARELIERLRGKEGAHERT